MAHRELACAQCIGADRLRPHDPVEQSGEQPLARLDELGVDVRRVELAQVDAGRGWVAKQPGTARPRSPLSCSSSFRGWPRIQECGIGKTSIVMASTSVDLPEPISPSAGRSHLRAE